MECDYCGREIDPSLEWGDSKRFLEKAYFKVFTNTNSMNEDEEIILCFECAKSKPLEELIDLICWGWYESPEKIVKGKYLDGTPAR